MSDREQLHTAFALESLGRELTRLAREAQLDPILAPEPLLQTLTALLAAGHSPVLVGRDGVGKRAAVEALAGRIAVLPRTLPESLRERLILDCDVTAFQSGCIYTHEFETRLESIVKKCREARAILSLNHLHLAVKAEGMSGYEERTVATLLTPYLSRQEVCVIGTTTPEGYRAILRQNARFATCLTPVAVPEHTAEQTLAMLEQLRPAFEVWYRMRIQPESLTEIIRMTRFYPWQAFPGKAFLLFKAALAQKAVAKTLATKTRRRAQRERGVVDWDDTELTAKTLAPRRRAQLTVRDIQTLVKTRTGLPSFLLFREEPVERQALVEKLRAQLFEQEQAIEAIVDTILTFKAELNDPERPLASFLCAGPTGVGKTECVKLVAELLFGSRGRVLKYDMGEYADPASVARLAGEGHQDGPRRGLVEEVLAEPFSVILFDEVEKSHPSFFSFLLPVLGEGRLTDVSGRTASFANAIIIMTSNLGADLYGRRPIGLSPSQAEGVGFEIERAILRQIRSCFSPEFLNRLTKILYFRPLSREAVARVAEKTVQEAFARPGLRDLNLRVSVDPSLFEQLLERGFHSEYGARPMQRAVEELVVYPLARTLAAGSVSSGQTAVLSYANGQTHLLLADRAGDRSTGAPEIERIGIEILGA